MEPIDFLWCVDQHGYRIEREPRARGLLSDPGDGRDEWDEFLVPVGGPPRYYEPLKQGELWLQFADTCQSADGVLWFAAKYGGLTAAKFGALGDNFPFRQREILSEFLRTARCLK